MAEPMAAGLDTPSQLGRYRIVGRLGSGGMAEVLLGSVSGPEGFQRPVVLKRILPHLAQEPHFRDMFLDEARIVARIRHQNVVQVHELAEDRDELFMVMEYLEGETVGSIARRLAGRKRTMPFGLTAHVVAEICGGLTAAHDLTNPSGGYRTVVHRDISPSNLLVTYQGEVKLIDFGVAFAKDRLAKTEPGVIKGKHRYMSPEQIRGETLDPRSDLFSLGAVLYELLTARHLFERDAVLATLKAVASEPIPNPTRFSPACPVALEQICLKALNRDLAQRFQSAVEMRRALIKVANEESQGRDFSGWLRDVMEKLFQDRIEQKRQMLSKLEEGRAEIAIPRGETDQDVIVRTALEPTGSSSHAAQPFEVTAPPPPEPAAKRHEPSSAGPHPRLKTAFIVGLGGLLAVFMMVLFLGGSSEGESKPLPSTEFVTLHVSTTPAGAAVYLAGEVRGRTPLNLLVVQGQEPLEVGVRYGNRGTSIQVVPDRDRNVIVPLPVATEPAPEVPAAAPEAMAPRPTDIPRATEARQDEPAPRRAKRKKASRRKRPSRKRRRKSSDDYQRFDNWSPPPP